MSYAAAYFSAPCDPISIIFWWMMEKSHIFKSNFINLYDSSTNIDTETFFGQNNPFHTVVDSIYDSIFLVSTHVVPDGHRITTQTNRVINAIIILNDI